MLTQRDSATDGKVRMKGSVSFMSCSTNPTVSSRARRSAIIRRIATCAVFAALSEILMFLEIPLPLMPPFLKFDFSEIPVLVGAFALGPVYGIVIELAKNLIHLPFTGTMGIGELSNFITGSLYVGTAGLFYVKHRTLKGAITSMIIGTLALALVAVPVNAFLTLPLYGSVMNFSTDAIISMSAAVNPLIKSQLTLLVLAFVPFNLFKGTVVSIVTFIVYKPVSRLIDKNYKATNPS